MNNELAKQDLKQMREEKIQVVTTVRCDPRKGLISKESSARKFRAKSGGRDNRPC